jgi:hypothetical protein
VRIYSTRTLRQVVPALEHDGHIKHLRFLGADNRWLLTVSGPPEAIAANHATLWDARSSLPAAPPIPIAGELFDADASSEELRLLVARPGMTPAEPHHLGLVRLRLIADDPTDEVRLLGGFAIDSTESPQADAVPERRALWERMRRRDGPPRP